MRLLLLASNVLLHTTRTASVSMFFNRIYANFFSDFTQIFFDWSVRFALYVSTELFSLEATSLKKKHFQIVYHILRCNFSGIRRKFSSTAVTTAMDSRFLIGFMSNFSELCATFVSWSVRSALQVSTGLFQWEASSLKKLLFNLYFTFLAEILRKIRKKLA